MKEEEKNMYCGNCGTQNDDRAMFCQNCGAKLEGRAGGNQNQQWQQNIDYSYQNEIPGQVSICWIWTRWSKYRISKYGI